MSEEILQEGEQPAPPKKSRTKLIVAISVIASVIVALASFLMIWYLADRYDDFRKDFREAFSIPGLESGFVPQGLGNYSGDGVFFISGYMNRGGASRIYVVEDGAATGYVTVTNTDGSVYDGHACGVATNGTKFWLVSEGTVFVLNYSDVVNSASADGGVVTVQRTWDPHCNADFCYASGSYIYVGEFYRDGNYDTDESHHMTTNAGDEHYAVIFRYSASTTSPTTPSLAYSITDRIQGMAISEDGSKIAISQSYGLSNSHILVYDLNSAATASAGIRIGSSTISTRYIDSSILTEDYEIPCMSEGMCTVNDRVYVLFESASDKYKLFVRERLDSVYTFRFR